MAAARSDNQSRGPAAAERVKRVVAKRKVRRERFINTEGPSIFKREFGGTVERGRMTGLDREYRGSGWFRLLTIGAHRSENGRACVSMNLMPLA